MRSDRDNYDFNGNYYNLRESLKSSKDKRYNEIYNELDTKGYTDSTNIPILGVIVYGTHEFSKLYPRGTKLPQVDAIRDTHKVIDINGLKQINQHIVKKSVENKVFEKGTIDGYTVVAIDGTKFFGSTKKSCPECLKNPKGKKTHCFHSGAVMSNPLTQRVQLILSRISFQKT